MSQEQESRETASQNQVSQEGTELKRTHVERIEEAAQTIVRAIESGSDRFWEAQVEAQAKATKPENRLVTSLTFLASTWVVFFAIGSALTLFAGWVLYEVKPLHTLERIGREQQQVRAQKELSQFRTDLGNSLLNVGQATAAKAEFERALELDPFNRKAEMGTVKSELFESVEAKNYEPAVIGPKLNKLVEERPKDTHAYAFRGTLRYLEVIPDPYLPKKQQYELYKPALSDFEKAIDHNDSNAYAYGGIAGIYYDLGQFDTQLKYAEKAYHLASRDPSYKHNYANALYANKRYEDAIKEYEEITYLDPQYMWAYQDLAQLYRLTEVTDDYELYSNLYYYSLPYYKQFIDMLEDKEITSLEKNQGVGAFTTGPHSHPVILSETPDFKYYAYYSIALTSYLLGQTKDAKRYVNEAKNIQVTNSYIKSEVERLLEYDIKLLQDEQESLSGANAFKKKYLTFAGV